MSDAPSSAPIAADALAAARRTHEALSATVASLDADGVRTQSYDDEWTIAQVLSHLGSGAEIFTLFLSAVQSGDELPGSDVMQPIWDVWNAKSPEDQARDSITANLTLIESLEAVPAADRETWSADLFGAQRSFADFVLMRLSEQAVHSWDAIVAVDPSATIEPTAVALIPDRLGEMLTWIAKPTDARTLVVEVADPDARYLLALDPEGSSLSELAADDDPAADGTLRLSAEAFIRLLTGRLDPDHTPADVHADGVELDDLRKAFPGF